MPSRYEAFKTCVDSKWVRYSSEADKAKIGDVRKIYIESDMINFEGLPYSSFPEDNMDLYTALNQYVRSNGFTIVAKDKADLVVKISPWKDESGQATPQFLGILNSYEYLVYNFTVEFLKYVSPEFLMGDLYIDKLRNALKDERLANKILLERVGLNADMVTIASEKTLLYAFNDILKMRDFHSKIGVDQYKPLISSEMQQLLMRDEVFDPNLTDEDYLRLNRALLEAIYPQEVKKSMKNDASFVRSYKVVQRLVYDRSFDYVNFWSTIVYNLGEDIIKFAGRE